jgi:hypothetical protein
MAALISATPPSAYARHVRSRIGRISSELSNAPEFPVCSTRRRRTASAATSGRNGSSYSRGFGARQLQLASASMRSIYGTFSLSLRTKLEFAKPSRHDDDEPRVPQPGYTCRQRETGRGTSKARHVGRGWHATSATHALRP